MCAWTAPPSLGILLQQREKVTNTVTWALVWTNGTLICDATLKVSQQRNSPRGNRIKPRHVQLVSSIPIQTRGQEVDILRQLHETIPLHRVRICCSFTPVHSSITLASHPLKIWECRTGKLKVQLRRSLCNLHQVSKSVPCYIIQGKAWKSTSWCGAGGCPASDSLRQKHLN